MVLNGPIQCAVMWDAVLCDKLRPLLRLVLIVGRRVLPDSSSSWSSLQIKACCTPHPLSCPM